MENKYEIKRGEHFSRGRKKQPMLLYLIVMLASVVWSILVTIPNGLMPITLLTCFAVITPLYVNELRNMKNIRMGVRFNDDCLYDGNPEKDGVNKLFGVGFGDHLKYSGRFGWNSNGKQINIFGYVRNEGRIECEHIMSCGTGEKMDMILRVTDDNYIFSIYCKNGTSHSKTMKRKSGKIRRFLPYRLYPYFGGNKVAPSDMSIFLERIE